MDSRFLTVAGAALALRQDAARTSFPFHPTADFAVRAPRTSAPQDAAASRESTAKRQARIFIGRGGFGRLLQSTFKTARYCLTEKHFYNKLINMKGDLTALENKIEQFLAFCQSLRAENQALRSRVAGLEDERQLLVDKIDTARTRLEALMERLPE